MVDKIAFMDSKTKGTLCGVGAAVSYGMNPLGALSLFGDGLNANSVLFYRFALAVAIVGGIMAFKGKSFKVSAAELLFLAFLGVVFAMSSVTLYTSFFYMDAGVASTMLFVYPIMVAVIMAVFFREKVTKATVVSIVLALSGIALLCKGGGGAVMSAEGVGLVMLSSLSYAVYIVAVNKWPVQVPTLKMSFYVTIFCALTVVAHSFVGGGRLQMLSTGSQWIYASILAVFPSVVSLLLMTVAVRNVGSTPAAIMGALEPMTAVVIGVTVFGEAFTPRLAAGIVLVLFGVLVIVAGRKFSPRRLAGLVSHAGHTISKRRWHWK